MKKLLFVLLSLVLSMPASAQPKIGLVLGGGGAKGASEVGVLKVLEKYDYEIPQMSNAAYNFQLKELQKMAGIKTRLHSHLARHSNW